MCTACPPILPSASSSIPRPPAPPPLQVPDGSWSECSPVFRTLFPSPPPNVTAQVGGKGAVRCAWCLAARALYVAYLPSAWYARPRAHTPGLPPNPGRHPLQYRQLGFCSAAPTSAPHGRPSPCLQPPPTPPPARPPPTSAAPPPLQSRYTVSGEPCAVPFYYRGEQWVGLLRDARRGAHCRHGLSFSRDTPRGHLPDRRALPGHPDLVQSCSSIPLSPPKQKHETKCPGLRRPTHWRQPSPLRLFKTRSSCQAFQANNWSPGLPPPKKNNTLQASSSGTACWAALTPATAAPATAPGSSACRARRGAWSGVWRARARERACRHWCCVPACLPTCLPEARVSTCTCAETAARAATRRVPCCRCAPYALLFHTPPLPANRPPPPRHPRQLAPVPAVVWRAGRR